MKLLKSLREQALLATGNFAKLFGDLDIPPLPQAAVRLLSMVRQEDVEIADVAKVISSDTGLATRVLKTVNSAYFGLRRTVTDVHRAVVLLGIQQIRTLALAYSATRVLPTRVPGFDPIAFWQDSLQRAAFAQALAPHVARDAKGEAFTGALLQEMALPILLSQWGDHYRPVVEETVRTGQCLAEVEKRHFSWDHTQAGAWMAKNWGFADVLVCCIGLHHASSEDLEALQLSESPVVAVAVSARLPNHEPIMLDYFAGDEGAYAQVCQAADSTCAELAQLFGIPAPRPLREEHLVTSED